MSAPVEASNGRVNVQVRGMGFEGMVMTDSKGRYKIRNVPAGMRELCVQGHPYRTVFDTVKVVKGENTRRDYVLQPLSSRHQPYPTCDHSLPTLYVAPVDSGTIPVMDDQAHAIWDVLLGYYRQTLKVTEGDLIKKTSRILGRSRDSTPAGVVLKPARRSSATRCTAMARVGFRS